MQLMKYKFVKGKNTGESAIQIDEGKYTDVVFTYGKVGFNELENECRLYFDYLVLDKEEIVEDHDDFKEVIGDILVDVLENHAEEYEYGDNRNDHTSQSDSE